MTLGEKLAKLRKENNYTQEQLAEILGVSRQAISKWESDATYPETEKLIRLAKMYDCSLDYLLLDKEAERGREVVVNKLNLSGIYLEKVSEKKIGNLPLWHINIGHGRVAKGIFAVGYASVGVVSVGLVSVGLVSVGILAVGLLALGSFAAGLIALGAICAGILAIGAVAIGIFAMGASAIGQFAVGAAALGNYAALGDSATAAIAIGMSEAHGTEFQIQLRNMTGSDFQLVWRLLEEKVPFYLKGFIQLFLGFLE